MNNPEGTVYHLLEIFLKSFKLGKPKNCFYLLQDCWKKNFFKRDLDYKNTAAHKYLFK